jgi:hypothetical protein
MLMLNAHSRLSLILWIVALHSFCVGVGLILMPPEAMQFFGFNYYREKFFPVQGGVFHIVMSVAYVMAAFRIEQFRGLIYLSVIAKFMAAVFLFAFYFLMQNIWSVLFSAVIDGIMGGLILWAFIAWLKSEENQINDFISKEKKL